MVPGELVLRVGEVEVGGSEEAAVFEGREVLASVRASDE